MFKSYQISPDLRIAQALTWRYLSALALIAVLATASWVSFKQVMTDQETTSAMVSISAQQLRLMQSTSLLATLYVNAAQKDRPVIKQLLQDSLNLFVVSHQGLTHGNEGMHLPSTMSPKIDALYFKGVHPLDARVRAYIRAVQQLLVANPATLQPDSPILNYVLNEEPTSLAQSLRTIETQYEQEGEVSAQHLMITSTLFWLLTLLLLVLEATLIFRPFTRHVKEVIERLQSVSDELESHQHHLDDRIRQRTEQLEHMAHYDVLTGLPNRILLADRLRQAMLQAKQHGLSLAVAYLDLDGFKAVNDTYGHDAGDLLLKSVGNRMQHALRDGDTLTRLGGDEFVAVLLNIPDRHAIAPLLQRLLDAASEPVPERPELQVSASIGVTFYPQEDDVEADQLLRQADHAMYQAKLAGKNRYYIFDAEHDRNLRGQHKSMDFIQQALQANEFLMYYQPKVNMRTGEVVGAEALVRWQHPVRGLLPPGAFLPAIEDSPLIVDMGKWVLEAVMVQMEVWQDEGMHLPISVNVAARHLQEPDFVDQIQALLAAHPKVPPSQLELEVLETSALEDLTRISGVIKACRTMGVQFSLDDFGTGYSSLTYLKKLPIALLKIDQGFVRDMLDDPEDLAILEGVLGLANVFRRSVIAEGVETLAHGEILLQLGCELAQGYGISRPMPASELPKWTKGWVPDQLWLRLPSVRFMDLPLLFASVEHRAWIASVESFLKDKHDVLPPMNQGQCRFGAWLDGEGHDQYGDSPDFHFVKNLHARIHLLGQELTDFKFQHKNHKALDRLAELHTLRDQLLDHLGHLKAVSTEVHCGSSLYNVACEVA